MPLVWILASVFGFLGVALVIRGLVGRRIDDHPICRKCRFDLVGLYDPAQPTREIRCPECGAELQTPATTNIEHPHTKPDLTHHSNDRADTTLDGGTGVSPVSSSQTTGETPVPPIHQTKSRRKHKPVRLGARRKRRGALTVGVVFLLASLSIVGALGWGAANTYNWNTIKPTWWLLLESKSADAAIAQPVLAELVSRAAKGKLPQPTVERLAQRGLVIQANDNATWLPEWGDLIELAYRKGWLSDEDIQQYAQRALDVSILVRSPIMLGAESSMSIAATSGRSSSGTHSTFEIIFDMHEARLDTTLLDDINGHGGFSEGAGGSGSIGLLNTFTPRTPGEHTIDATIWMYLKTHPLMSGRGGFGVWAQIGSYTPSQNDLGPWTIHRTADFTVLPKGQSDVTLTEALDLIEAVRKSIQIQDATLTHNSDTDFVSISVMIVKPPMNVAFHISLRTDGAEIPLGFTSGVPGSSHGMSLSGKVDHIDLNDAQLIFRADEEAVRQTKSLHDAWAGEIVIDDLTFEEIDHR